MRLIRTEEIACISAGSRSSVYESVTKSAGLSGAVLLGAISLMTALSGENRSLASLMVSGLLVSTWGVMWGAVAGYAVGALAYSVATHPDAPFRLIDAIFKPSN